MHNGTFAIDLGDLRRGELDHRDYRDQRYQMLVARRAVQAG